MHHYLLEFELQISQKCAHVTKSVPEIRGISGSQTDCTQVSRRQKPASFLLLGQETFQVQISANHTRLASISSTNNWEVYRISGSSFFPVETSMSGSSIPALLFLLPICPLPRHTTQLCQCISS